MTLLAGGLAAAVVFLALYGFFRRRRTISPEAFLELVQRGAQIVDVRTPREFAAGHAEACRNIPLDQLMARIQELDPATPTVVCCASGARSSVARSMLIRAGLTDVHDLGPWQAARRA
ncbi:MAG TPA: rhodanese-like domain-containing protein [Holophaga sp.]|nr:rhodanese-like domain-containing protein [Holophaga sp.]